MDAALRELAEETGVVPDRDTMGVDFVGDFYSSEGMTDELAHIMVLHLGPVQAGAAAISTRTSTWNPRGFPWKRHCRHAHHLIQFDDRHPA